MKSIQWLGLWLGMMILNGCGQSPVAAGSAAQVEARIKPVGEVAMVPAPVPVVSEPVPSTVTAVHATDHPAQAPSLVMPAQP